MSYSHPVAPSVAIEVIDSPCHPVTQVMILDVGGSLCVH